MICGARGVPGTVAPFRAWRGSRDLVAQSPKLHAPAVAHNSTAANDFSTAFPSVRSVMPVGLGACPVLARRAYHPIIPSGAIVDSGSCRKGCAFSRTRFEEPYIFFGAAAGITSAGFTQFTLNGPVPCT